MAKYGSSPLLVLVMVLSSAVTGQNGTRGEMVPAMFIFGDSLIDNGNNNNLPSFAKANYFPYGIDFNGGPTGRFSNGYTMVDEIAELLGLPLIPAYSEVSGDQMLHGVNYASAAAGILDITGRNFIRELLETFGPLRGFDLVKDRETGNSKGYAFCVYQDLAVTDIACAALNGIKMGDKTLTVRRANQGANQPKPEQESVLMLAQQQIALQKLMFQPELVGTMVVCLTQAVSADELKEDEDYEEIIDDMRQECSKFGTLVNVVIPRAQPNEELSAGVGKVFLEYADIDGATKARTGLNGRKFGGNQVAVFYPENKFAQGDYEG